MSMLMIESKPILPAFDCYVDKTLMLMRYDAKQKQFVIDYDAYLLHILFVFKYHDLSRYRVIGILFEAYIEPGIFFL